MSHEMQTKVRDADYKIDGKSHSIPASLFVLLWGVKRVSDINECKPSVWIEYLRSKRNELRY